ncbi:unnamed protein product [Didymodactylos carnosus]|uniref:Retrotransposon gag domain-containing protein n=1 Tax=Didymodactylos carnosus TaxID=1234261 RepID=A0A8S2NW26_9BILA|nr:unnamed protein product [Didymodactylos carnosus]CAF4020631.1 unnamed protein product [Didymodactylos carnosus]
MEFDAYESIESQRRKWAVAFLSDEVLKRYTRQLIKFETWNDLQNALQDNFPSLPELSQFLRHRQILLRKQADTEETLTQYYGDMTKLCTHHNPVMTNAERIDRLKLGMNTSLLNRCSRNQIKPSTEKIQGIVELSPPKPLNEANEFIGKLNWYRKFIPNFAEIAAPIHKVTNKTKKTKHDFYWHKEQ